MLADDFMLRDGYPRGRLSQCAKRDRFPQIPASLRSERRFVAARVESSFQAKDEQVYSAADWLTH